MQIGMHGDDFKPRCLKNRADVGSLRRPDLDEEASVRLQMVQRASGDSAISSEPVGLIGERDSGLLTAHLRGEVVHLLGSDIGWIGDDQVEPPPDVVVPL